jgi:hypothetical protein
MSARNPQKCKKRNLMTKKQSRPNPQDKPPPPKCEKNEICPRKSKLPKFLHKAQNPETQVLSYRKVQKPKSDDQKQSRTNPQDKPPPHKCEKNEICPRKSNLPKFLHKAQSPKTQVLSYRKVQKPKSDDQKQTTYVPQPRTKPEDPSPQPLESAKTGI